VVCRGCRGASKSRRDSQSRMQRSESQRDSRAQAAAGRRRPAGGAAQAPPPPAMLKAREIICLRSLRDRPPARGGVRTRRAARGGWRRRGRRRPLRARARARTISATCARSAASSFCRRATSEEWSAMAAARCSLLSWCIFCFFLSRSRALLRARATPARGRGGWAWQQRWALSAGRRRRGGVWPGASRGASRKERCESNPRLRPGGARGVAAAAAAPSACSRSVNRQTDSRSAGGAPAAAGTRAATGPRAAAGGGANCRRAPRRTSSLQLHTLESFLGGSGAPAFGGPAAWRTAGERRRRRRRACLALSLSSSLKT